MKKTLIGTLLFAVLISCEDDSNEYRIGNNIINSESRIVKIDTLTTYFSTVILDSVKTSGDSKILIGNIEDPSFGKITSSSLFQIEPTSYKISNVNTPKYDSLIMYLTYNDYYYGDTLSTYKLNVVPVNQKIKLNDDGYLTNISKTKLSNEIIGSASFLPRPNTDSTYVRIPLSDDYGKNMFDLLRTKDVINLDYFLNFYKGLAIIPDQNNKAMLRYGIDTSFKVDPENKNISTLMRLYYHTDTQNGTEPIEYTVDINFSSLNQYNQIKYDFSNSELQGLSPSNPLDSRNTNNKSYMINGIGVYTKIEIPYLNKVQDLFNNYSLISANLEAKPVINSYSKEYYRPENLYMYLLDKYKNLSSIYTDSEGNNVSATLDGNGEYQKDHKYTLSVSNFINILFNDGKTNNYKLLLYPGTNGDPMINKLIIGNSKHPTNPSKFNLHFLGY